MLKPVYCLLLTALVVAATTVYGAEVDDARVKRYFEGLKSLRADFVQTVFDDQAQLIQASSGRMHMQRPRRFSWDYQEPYPQLIVADGERVWLYDSDLEQVSVKRMDKALGSTPLALLSGAAPIEEAFTVARAFDHSGLHWYELHPKGEQPEFKTLWVGFNGDTLSAIELEDDFSQRTRLSFDNIERNIVLDPALFVFIPPPGVDVVGDLP